MSVRGRTDGLLLAVPRTLLERLCVKRARTVEKSAPTPRTPLQRFACGAHELGGPAPGACAGVRAELQRCAWAALGATAPTPLPRAAFGPRGPLVAPPTRVDSLAYDSSGLVAAVLAGRLLFVVGGNQAATRRAPAVRRAKVLSRACSAVRWRPGPAPADVLGVPLAAGQPLALYSAASRSPHSTARMPAPPTWGRCTDAAWATPTTAAAAFRDGRLRLWDVRAPASSSPSITVDWFASALVAVLMCHCTSSHHLLCFFSSECGPLVSVLGCSARGTGGMAVCCLSDGGAVCVWDLRARRRLARCDAGAALRGAGWRDAAFVCGAAQCPYSAQHVIVTASDTQATLAVALLDVTAGTCVSYTTHAYTLPQQPLQQQPQQQTPMSTVWDDGSTYVPNEGVVGDESSSRGGAQEDGAVIDVTAALNRRSPVVCLDTWQCAARHAVAAAVLAPDGLQRVVLPMAPPDPTRVAVDWDRAVVSGPVLALPPIDTYALHPRAPLGSTFLCARGSSLFHITTGVESDCDDDLSFVGE